jgi:hypothetical protein
MKAPLASIAGLTLGLLVMFFLAGGQYKKKANLYEQTTQQHYKKRELELQTELRRSDSAQKVLLLRLDSAVLIVDSLVREVQRNDRELSNIPGSFNSLASREIERRIMEEYNKRK